MQSLSLVRRLRGALPLLVLAPLAAAQDPQPGFQVRQLSYPAAGSSTVTATVEGGDVIVFDGLVMDRYTEDGGFVYRLAELESFVFPSFLVVDPDADYCILGDSSNGELIRVEIDGTFFEPVVSLAFNYDAVFEAEDTLIVSAATCGLGCGNEIYRVDLDSGQVTLLAQVSGPSGPVALDPSGNLCYATSTDQFPPPPGVADVIRWSASQLTGGEVLTEADATVVGSGFEGGADLAIDPATGSIYMAENNYGSGVNRIRQVLGSPAVSPILFEGALFESVGNLEFESEDGMAAFIGYQPSGGGVLRFNATDFVGVFDRRELSARRPAASIFGPGTSGPGDFTVALEGGPPNGTAYVFYGPSTLYDPVETPIPFLVPLFVGLDLVTLARQPVPMFLDGDGCGELSYQNPGGLEGQFALQLLVYQLDGRIAGTSTAAFL